MKIVIDTRLWGIEHRGLGRYVEQLVTHLAQFDLSTDFILLTNPHNKTAPQNLPPNFKLQPAPWRIYSWQEQIYLPRLLNQLKPDLVFFPHFNVPFFIKQPYIVTIHDLILHHYPSSRATTLPKPIYWLKILAYKIVLKRVINRARTIITISEATGNDIKKFYPKVANKINIIPIAPAEKVAPTEIILPENYFLTVGAAYPHKNLEMLIRAFQMTRLSRPEIKLIIVGKKDFFMKRLEQEVINNCHSRALSAVALAKEEGGNPDTKNNTNIIFWGEADETTLATLYTHTSAYLLPSLIEGFGLGPLEALQYGAPIIVSDIQVLKEILEDSVTFVNPNNENLWAEAMLQVLNENKNLINAANLLQKYNWTTCAQLTAELLKSLTKTTIHV